MREDEMRDNPSGNRGNRQIQALYAQRGQANQHTGQHGHRATGQQIDDEGRANTNLQNSHGVSAQPHEGGLPQAHQTGVAREDIQPGGTGNVDCHQTGKVKPVFAGDKRKGAQGDNQDADPDSLGAAVEQGRIKRVAFFGRTNAH